MLIMKPFVQTKPAFLVLERLSRLNDERVLKDACWALSYLFDGTNYKIQAVIEAGVCPPTCGASAVSVILFLIFFYLIIEYFFRGV